MRFKCKYTSVLKYSNFFFCCFSFEKNNVKYLELYNDCKTAKITVRYMVGFLECLINDVNLHMRNPLKVEILVLSSYS